MIEHDLARRQQSAVALAYQAGDGAPKVVAKGSGLVAEQIIERARDAGVFVHQSRELVGMLMNVDLDAQIPPSLYRAIAELLAWLYHIESMKQLLADVPPPEPPVFTLPRDEAAPDE